MQTLINELNQKGIFLYVENSKLKTKSVDGAITEEIANQIKKNKNEIISFLTVTDVQNNILEKITPIAERNSVKPSYTQQRLWLLDQIDGGSAHYNLASIFSCQGQLNYKVLEQVFTTIVARHESLRTCFAVGEKGQALQVIQAITPFHVPLTDLSALSEEKRENQLAEIISEESTRVFSLASDLMLRAQLVKLAQDEHIVLVTMHHIAADGWSMSILINEFSALYSAYAQGQENPLPPLAIQYADYAHWQRNWLQGDVLNQQLDYWQKQLASLPVVHNVRLDQQRPLIQSFAGATYNSRIDVTTSKNLIALCQSQGATLFMGLHAAFSVLLSRYSNETDIVVGSPIANREQAQIAGLIGFFVNTLVLRSDLSESPSFTRLLNQSKTMLLNAYAHQQVPFEQIVERLQPERSLSHSALFQIMLVLQNNEQGVLELPGLTLSPVEQSGTIAKYDLTLNVVESEAGLLLGWEYNIDLFEANTIARMANHFELLVNELVAKPNDNVFKIEMLSAQERQQLLVDWNNTQTDYPNDKCIHELFEVQVETNPNAIAVTFEKQQLTYEQLNQKANQLAHYLITEKQIKPDTLVGICVERSLEMVIGILAILKAGGAYVPLDPEYPEARLKYMLDDAQLTTVLTQSHLRETTPVNDAQAVCLDDENVKQQLQNYPTTNVKINALNPNHLAYVIYTSGSTGNPKGAEIVHRSVTSLVVNNNYVRLSPDTVMLQNAPVAFDAATFEIWGALLNGGRLAIQGSLLVDMDTLGNFLHSNAINTAWMTSGLFDQFVSLYENKLPHLEYLLVGGDIVNPHSVNRIKDRNPRLSVINGYGPTENTTFSCCYPIPNLATGVKSIPIGKPLANRMAYVLDSYLQSVPQGVAGELYVAGTGIARGYLNRPDLTAEKFIANPFYDKTNSASSERLYKTGDLVRWLPDGNLEYLGRIDHQVKIRGFRIELGEIENTLSSFAAVKDAVVLAKESPATGDKRLVAYVVTGQQDNPDENTSEFVEQLRQHLSQTLPDYMVPSAFVLLESLPLTTNGKVDRKALPEPDFTAQQNVYVAPTTETEKILCEIWQEVLGVERVGITDNFFQLGGHSLLIMQVIARLQQQGITMTARQLFTTPSLGELANTLDASGNHGQPLFKAPANLIAEGCTSITPDMLPLVDLSSDDIALIVDKVPGGVANVQDIYPLGPLQEGILFQHMMGIQGDAYVLPALFKMDNRKVVTDFIEALQFIINRHDVLRTAILWKGLSVPVQVVCRHAEFPVTWLELDLSETIEVQMRSRCEPGKQWMELGQAPLLQVQIAVDPASQQHFVLLQYHHIISDHVGLEIIQKEFALYQAGQGDSLPAPIPYREFVAHAQHQALHNNAKDFFSGMLGDVEEPTAPFGLHDANGDGSRIVEAKAAIPASVSSDVRRIAKDLKVSPAALFHTAWAMVIAACSGRDDVVFGTVLSGRLQGTVGAEHMLGVFINTLPLRVKLQTSVTSTVLHVQESLLDLLPYEQSSLALAQRCSGLPAGSPLFTAMFNYRHSAAEAADDATNNAGVEFLAGQERTNYPFTLSVDDFGDAFGLDVQVDNSLDAERIVGYVQTAVAGLVEALQHIPEQSVTSLSILPKAERQQLLVDWNNTQTDYPNDKCIHELFETQVETNPNAIAVTFENQQLTYEQLNQKANQLAHYLINEKHIKPDTLVGICVERSLEMVIGILAILKAGGAYVPLDPEYPEARLKYMLDDAQLTTVLTQSHLRETTPVNDAQAVCLDDENVKQQLQNYPTTNVKINALNPNHLAYVIYTSGSTGNPKGAEIVHRSVTSLVVNNNYVRLSPDTVMLQNAPVAFDAATFEIWGALLNGGRLAIQGSLLVDMDTLGNFLHSNAINTAWMTSGLFDQFVSLYENKLPHLEYLLVGGDIVNPHSVNRIKDRNPRLSVINGYGPTENTTFSCCYPIPNLATGVKSIPIGKPLANRMAYVLDSYLQSVPQGVAGELYVAGTGIARGYLNRPDLTAEKFIANPFYDETNSASSERLYKTGDLVRWLPDGNLEYLGRIDHQVKIRGFRIELGEIENTLSSFAAVKDAVVLAKESPATGDKRLVAYVVVEQENTPELIESLRHHLHQTLPDYMVPSAFVLLESLPLTTNGKVDRKALPEPDFTAQQNVYVAPTTETEKILCEIWQEVLGVERVGITDNFFQLGGHSLLIMQVIARLQQQGLVMTARQLFTTPSLGELANTLDASGNHGQPLFKAPANLIAEGCTSITPDMLPLVDLSSDDIALIVDKVPGGVANVQDIYPLGPLQEGILFQHMMGIQGDPYVLPSLFKLNSRKAVTGFIDTLQFITNRHDALRTAILWKGLSVPVQVVCRHASIPVSWPELDPSEPVEAQMRARCVPGRQWMDLGQAPLLQLQIAAGTTAEEHYILLQYHHIISDHVGLEIIQKELAVYQAGQGDSLPAPIPYREFIAHVQHQALHNDATTFFTEVLGDIEEPTAPFGLRDVNGDGSRIIEAKADLPRGIASDLRRLAKGLQVSPAALFHTAWAMVVAACSGRDDVVFGTVLSGRLQGTVGAEHMLGVFINTLPLRVKLHNASVIEAVRHVQESLRDLLPYEQCSLVLAQRCSGLPAGLPLFTAMLNYRHSSADEASDTTSDSADSQEIEFLTGQERTNYPFMLAVDDFGDAFALNVQVENSLDAASIMGYVQTAVVSLVDALLNTPEQSVTALPILPEAERQKLLVDWNNTQVDYPNDKCIHELFEAQAKTNPDAIAVTFENQTLSYQQLNEKSNQLAHYLINEKHVKPDTLVGICVERSLDMVVGILAILKSGGAYVPLDPEYPEARLKYMLDDAQLTTVLTQSHLRETTPVSDAQAVCLDSAEIQQQLQTQSIQNPNVKELGESGLTSNNLAYVIYTSGSTGNPKGVLVEHYNITRLLDSAREDFEFNEQDVWTLFHSYAFDFSVWEIWGALAQGGRLVVVPYWVSRSPSDFYQLLSTEGVTVLNQTPSAFTMLVQEDAVQNTPLSLRYVVFGGEALNLASLLPWFTRHGDNQPQLINMYGITETTVHVTYRRITQDLAANASGASLIGKPLSDLQLVVLNDQQRLVPVGVAGEMYVGGAGVTRGYLNQPELTQSRFVSLPDVGGKVFYRTGDLARYLSHGELEYLGRIDHQVKIRGFRIELGEIESALASHELVKDAIVLAKASATGTGDKRLVAYVVTGAADLQNDTDVTISARHELIEQLRQHLGQTLPDYMVPSAFVLLESLPLTTNGKVDRKALPEPDFAAQQNTYVAPTTETEKILCEIWQDVLGVERVGITDNFFQLGGHSLLIMQVIARLQQQGLVMTARELFTAPSLGDLAIALDASGNHGQPVFKAPANRIAEGCTSITPEMLPLVELSTEDIALIVDKVPGGVANVQDIYPLGPLQEGILFQHMMATQGDPYVLPSLFKLNSRQAVTDFIDALQFITNRHDTLRTAIIWQGLSVPVQVVCRHANVPVSWPELDPSEPVEAQMRARCVPGQQWMDLGQAPLLQLQIAEGPTAEEHYILLQYHHIISDHVGLEIIQKELALYQAGQGDSLPAPIPYREFIAHTQHQALHNDATAFFTQTLGDVEEPTAPFDVRDVNGDGSRIVEVKADLPHAVSSDLRRLAKGLQVSPAALFHTAWAMVVGACSGRDDVVFGTVMSGRLQGTVGAEHMLGVFINTLPLRVKLRNASVIEAVRHVQDSLLDLLPYEQSSLALAQRCSALPVGSPLFTAMFNYRHSSADEASDGVDDQGIEFLTGQERTNYPFTLAVDDFGDAFALDVQVHNSLDADRIMGYVQVAIAGLAQALSDVPEQPITALSILPEQERQQLLVDWNNTQADYPNDKCIHELFEAQVETNPDSIAVIFENQMLSYQQLNEKANQLAHYLISEKQVTPDTLVGICIERSLEMVIGILAILKAGGAYVPLDPEYPEARLKYMLDDAQLTTVLTQSHLRETTPVTDQQAVYLDGDAFTQQLLSYSTANPTPELLGESGLTTNHLAYVIYTSGSTGNPKGVMAPHRSICNRIVWMEQQFPSLKADVFCQKTTIGFVDHVAEIFQALVYGHRLVIVKTSDLIEPIHFSKIVATQRISRLTLVPSLLYALIEQNCLSAMTSLRLVISSGEALQLDLARQFYRALPSASLLNLYGSSEIGGDVTAYLIEFFEENPAVMQYFLDPQQEGDVGMSRRLPTRFNYQAATPIPENTSLCANYNDSLVPRLGRDYQDYMQELNTGILPYSVDVSSERFIGHMTSKLPSFIAELNGLIAQLNQNMVKVETSNSLTLIERQILAMMHRLFFQLPDAFYDAYCQDRQHVFGMVTGGGSVANLTALWCARNRGLLARGITQDDILQQGSHALLQQQGFKRAVILGTRLMHYSMRKSAAVMGIGENGLMYIAQDDQQRMSIADLKRRIEECKANDIFVIAIVGLAGATETGTVDPLEDIAAIARENQIHFHVDAAWGGAFQLSERHRHRIAGVELADSVTFCPHKQLYLSQGISLCLMRDTLSASAIATHTHYQAQKGSYDLGQYTMEGSRPAHALLLHASLNLLGQQGYSWLIEQSMSKTHYFHMLLKKMECFDVIGQPDLNIINYRYIPISMRPLRQYSAIENDQISEMNTQIQQQQFSEGYSFVSKTTLKLNKNNNHLITVFRVVLSNPLSSFENLREVIADQLRIATELFEQTGDNVINQLPNLSVSDLNRYGKWNVPLGKPIANTQLYVLNDELQVLPSGVIGQLYVGGDNLVRGYLNRPDLTAEKFIANPFYDKNSSSSHSTHLYKTGDLVRWLPTGELEYLGRIDHQVKIRGFRIELGEIENTLSTYERVKEAVVIAKTSEAKDNHLIAYVVTDLFDVSEAALVEQHAFIEQLRHHVSKALPDYMVPSAFMILPQLPLLPNGKVDRKSLPETDFSYLQATYVAPRTKTEIALCEICQDLLKVERVGINDNFFQLGGHSLLLMKLLALLESKFGVNVGAKLIFECKNLQGLAEYLTLIGKSIPEEKNGAADGEEIEEMESFQI